MRPIFQFSFFSASRRVSREGFTLVELLVVMTVIMLLSGFVITAVGGDDGTRALESGVKQSSGLFSLARSGAVQRQTPFRVLVHNDPADPDDPDKYLRYLLVLYWDDSEESWELYAEGRTLPTGVYFSPGLSQRPDEGQSLHTWQVGVEVDAANVNVIQPEPQPRNNYSMGDHEDPLQHAGGRQWYVYEFNANGTARHPGRRFVLARGVLDPQAPDTLRIPQSNLTAGFVLFRGGRAVHFRDPEQILGGS